MRNHIRQFPYLSVSISLLSLSSYIQSAFALPEPIAEALPIPIAAPVPEPLPLPLPEAAAEADPEAQQYTNYAPFSGAIYIVNGNGNANSFSSASPAICPNNAQQSCGNLNVWNWCCPSGSTCAWLSNSIVGCCASGQTCSNVNNVNVAAATVTQTVYQQATVYQTQANTVVVAANPTTVVVAGGAVGVQTTQGVVYNGYCSTLTANGGDLPRTAQGACGTILVVNKGLTVRPFVQGRKALAVIITGMILSFGWWI